MLKSCFSLSVLQFFLFFSHYLTSLHFYWSGLLYTLHFCLSKRNPGMYWLYKVYSVYFLAHWDMLLKCTTVLRNILNEPFTALNSGSLFFRNLRNQNLNSVNHLYFSLPYWFDLALVIFNALIGIKLWFQVSAGKGLIWNDFGRKLHTLEGKHQLECLWEFLEKLYGKLFFLKSIKLY